MCTTSFLCRCSDRYVFGGVLVGVHADASRYAMGSKTTGCLAGTTKISTAAECWAAGMAMVPRGKPLDTAARPHLANLAVGMWGGCNMLHHTAIKVFWNQHPSGTDRQNQYSPVCKNSPTGKSWHTVLHGTTARMAASCTQLLCAWLCIRKSHTNSLSSTAPFLLKGCFRGPCSERKRSCTVCRCPMFTIAGTFSLKHTSTDTRTHLSALAFVCVQTILGLHMWGQSVAKRRSPPRCRRQDVQANAALTPRARIFPSINSTVGRAIANTLERPRVLL